MVHFMKGHVVSTEWRYRLLYKSNKLFKKSGDLTQLKYFLWSCVKAQDYKNNTQSKLKGEIICLIGEIERLLCKNVI